MYTLASGFGFRFWLSLSVTTSISVHPVLPFRDLSHFQVVGSAVKSVSAASIGSVVTFISVRIGEHSRQCIGHLRLSLRQIYRPGFFQVEDGDFD